MRVRVGTVNPVKVRATERAFLRAFPDREVTVEAVSVDPGVPPQPVGVEEVHRGARNRAREAWDRGGYSVGLEAGLVEIGDVHVDLHVAVVLDPEGREAVGTSPGFQLPLEVTERALSGEEVGEVFSEIVGVREIGKRSGAIGVLSDGKVLREDLCELAVLMALISLETLR
ncbi:inosine/xanthosine triphosphatase [Methanopyrus sp.]